MPIYRIRWRHGYRGGSNHYSHADVIAANGKLALKAAKEGRVVNWRRIDSFDVAPKDYSKYELLYSIDSYHAKESRRPISKKNFPTYLRELENRRNRACRKRRTNN